MTPCRTRRRDAETVARGRLDTRRCVYAGQARSHASATCVHDPGPGVRPDGRRRRSSAPGCGSSAAAVPGTPAGRIKESKKNFCCVTTRRRNFGVLRCLGCRLGSLPARTLRLRVLRFGRRIQPAPGLPLCCLPATDLPLTFRILAVTLVPAPRLVLLSAPLAQAPPRPRVASSGMTTTLCFILTGAHGSDASQGIARGERATVLPGRFPNRQRDRRSPVYTRPNEGNSEGNSFRKMCKKESMKNTTPAYGWLSSNAR